MYKRQVQRRRAGFANDGVAWPDWYPRDTQQQAKVRRARAAVTASEVSAVRVDWYADLKRRAEEAQAREGAAKSEAIDQWISWCQLTQPLTKRQDPGVDPIRMRCVAGEPAGLLFAILARSTGHEATVYEQAPPAESFGWGVVFWDGQLRQLDAHDARTGWLVREHAYTWADQVISVDGRDPVRMPSFGNCMRCRRLLELLRSQATDADAVARCADLVIASDGVNSTLRRQQSALAERLLWRPRPRVLVPGRLLALTPLAVLAAPVHAADHGSSPRSSVSTSLNTWWWPHIHRVAPLCPEGTFRQRCLDC